MQRAYHVTRWGDVTSIRQRGIRTGRGKHAGSIYLFGSVRPALAFADRYLLATKRLPSGVIVGLTDRAALLTLDVTGLELEPDPMQPPLPDAWRLQRRIEAERLIGVREVRLDRSGRIAMGSEVDLRA